MRIIQVVPSLEPQHGGPSKSVHRLGVELASLGHDVELYATHPRAARNGDTTTQGALRVTIFRREWPQRICRSLGLREALLAAPADIVHHHSLWLRTLHYAHRGAIRNGAVFVVSTRGMVSSWAARHHSWRKRMARWIIHPSAIASANGWHATSPDEAGDIRTLGVSAPICVAPNGVDAPSAAEVAAARAHWARECPEIADRPTALFYSRFHRKKRVLELIDIWLEHAGPQWLLLLVGVAEEYTPETLQAYIRERSGERRIRVFSGIGRPPPYAIASLFLLPSHNENFGLAIAEAMAQAVPAIVTDTTPWQQLNAERCGWCVPWVTFGQALGDATRISRNSLHQRGEAARDWVLREYSWNRSAQQMAEFYRSLLDHRLHQ